MARVCATCGTEETSFGKEGFKVTDHIGSGKTTIWCVACFNEAHNPKPKYVDAEAITAVEPKKRGRPKKEAVKDELPMTEEQAENSQLPVE